MLGGAVRKLQALNAAETIADLKYPSSNNLEMLYKERAGQWSIRINRQYRVCFEWLDGNAYNVEITDYH